MSDGQLNQTTFTALFKQMDKDGSGKLSVNELHQGLLSRGDKMTIAEVEALLHHYDANKDGELDFDEAFKLFTDRKL